MYNAVMKLLKKYQRFISILVVLALIIGGLLTLDTLGKTDVANVIDSFEDCAAGGHPIMESYPEQCAVPGGQTFTKQY